MLGERADQQDAVARHHHRNHVQPQRHAADTLYPQHDRDAPQQVLEPDGAHAGLVADHGLQLRAQESRDAPVGADQYAPGEGLLHARQHPARGAEPLPRIGHPVARLRVVQRVGEPVVDVVDQVLLAVALVRQPQRQRHEPQQPVEAPPARRVAMQDLVLQRAVERQQDRRDRRHQPQRPVAVGRGHGEPGGVGCDDQQQRRQLDGRRPGGGCRRIRVGAHGVIGDFGRNGTGAGRL